MARRAWTAVGAVVFAAVGFGIGAFGSAWQSYEDYADAWRKMRVDHEGVKGKPGHTRVVFDNPKLAVQAIDLSTGSDGVATSAKVSLKDGQQLLLTFDEKSRPASITGPDGAVAKLAYESGKTRVTFFSNDGSQVGTKKMSVPVQLVASAAPSPTTGGKLARLRDDVSGLVEREALADEAPDDEITVSRDVPVTLDVRVTGPDAGKTATATLDASCAPLACVPDRRDITVPGSTEATISVTGKVKKSTLAPAGDGDADAFLPEAKNERKAAAKDLPLAARVVAALGVTSMACKSLSLTSPICVKDFRSDPGVAGGAVTSFLEHEIPADEGLSETRARELFVEDEARATFDKDVQIQVCVVRDGYGRTCTSVGGRPFGATPMEKTSHVVEIHPMVGGTIAGSFVITQSDGADCKFSPSPRTNGAIKLTFDDDHNTVSASLSADQRGSRPNMVCSLGTANMNWFQNYSISASQTFTKEQLHAGGKLPLHLTGAMTGSGGYDFSNCRTSGGASANCPGGKNDGYSYSVSIDGTLDMDTKTGDGRIVVSNAPLATQGTWRIPAEAP